MANHKGIASIICIEGSPAGTYFVAPLWDVPYIVGAQHEAAINVFAENAVFDAHHNATVKTNHIGTGPLDFGDEFIYGRTWITPVIEAFGVMLATHIETISFWNAYKDRSVMLNAITGYLDCTGTLIDDSTLPDTFTPTAEGIYTLVVTMIGSATLDCYYLFVHDAPNDDNRLDITGTRILCLPFYHNWGKTYRIKYEAETIISVTKKLYEQRRPLYPSLRREISASDTFASSIKIKNYLKTYMNHIVALPLVAEPMTINLTGPLTGLTSLPINETISDFWNLAHTDYVVLVNTATGETEVCALLGYTTSLEVAALLNSWNAEDVIIYPIIFCVLTNHNISEITDLVAEISITAKEILAYV